MSSSPHGTGRGETWKVAAEETGRLLDQVGGYFRVRAQFTEAHTVHERTVAIGEATYGPTHPAVATYVNNLGRVLHDLGDLVGARAAYERALRIFQTYLGVEHPSTKTVQANLDALMRESGTSPGTA